MGFSEEQVRRMILQSVPQLATLLWSVCFTLVLAWFIASNHRYGFWRGLEAGCVAWSPVLLGLVVAIVYRGLPADLIWIYGSSSLVSSMVAGAILGTWTKGRILHALGEARIHRGYLAEPEISPYSEITRLPLLGGNAERFRSSCSTDYPFSC